MFEKYTDRSYFVLRRADEVRIGLKQARLAPDHVLLALSRDEGAAGLTLRSLGLSTESLRKIITAHTPANPSFLEEDDSIVSLETKRLLESADENATMLGDNFVDSYHILMGLAQLRGGIAIVILRELGVKPQDIIDRLFALRPTLSPVVTATA